jgi:hypothetical protein
MQQPRQPLGGGFLIPKAAGQLGLTARLLGNNRLHKVSDGFALMAMCPKATYPRYNRRDE